MRNKTNPANARNQRFEVVNPTRIGINFMNNIENTPSKFSNYEKYALTIGGLFEKDCIDD